MCGPTSPLPSVADSCGVAPTGLVFKAFAPVSGLFLLKSGACTADAADPVAIVAPAGTDIPLANFPVVETIQRGRARLKAPYLAPPGGAALVRSGSLHFDSVLKTDCEMITISSQHSAGRHPPSASSTSPIPSARTRSIAHPRPSTAASPARRRAPQVDRASLQGHGPPVQRSDVRDQRNAARVSRLGRVAKR